MAGMKKARRFSIIYCSREQAEEKLPFSEWIFWGAEGDYNDPAMAKEEAKRLEAEYAEPDKIEKLVRREDPTHWNGFYTDYEMVPNPYAGKPRFKFAIRAVPIEEDYRSREDDKIAAGEYTPLEKLTHIPGWGQYHLWLGDFAYPYIKDDKKISFYKDELDAKAGKRTVCTARRYLVNHLRMGESGPTTEVLNMWGILLEDCTLHFARTREEIRNVYINGPSSCMSHDVTAFSSDGFHPAEVYATPDLELAYMMNDEDITARALCNAKTKEYVRIYGDEARFEKMLEEAGYTVNSMCLGRCRLLKIFVQKKQALLMPYLDGAYTTILLDADDPDYVLIEAPPLKLRATDTTGYIPVRY